MNSDSAPSAKHLPLVAALVSVVLWAAAFVGIRAAGRSFSPGPLALGRLAIGSALLGAVVTKGDPKGAIAGILHVLTDEVASGNPEAKRILEGMARLDSILNRRYKARLRRRKSHRKLPYFQWK